MKEADLRNELQIALRVLGFWDYHPPDDTPVVTPTQIQQIIQTFKLNKSEYGKILNILHPPTWRRESVSLSRPDIFALNPVDKTMVIEVKAVEEKVRIETWLDPKKISNGQRDWLDRWQFDAEGQAYLAVGTLDNPRRFWVVDWDMWIELEKRCAKRDGTEKDFRVNLVDIPAQYELTWKGNGVWVFPEFHSIRNWATWHELKWKQEPHSFRFE